MRALSRYSASLTLAPKASQLFQPIGGVGAQAWKGRPGSAALAAAGVAELLAAGGAAGAAGPRATAASPAPATARTKLRRAGSSGELPVGVVLFMSDARMRDEGRRFSCCKAGLARCR